MKQAFSKGWKASIQPRKQRKYRANAPLHIKQRFMHVHLTKLLREKHKARSVRVREGDKVIVMRGNFKGKSGKVERVDIKHEKVYITGIDLQKTEGSKVLVPLRPSNLTITELKMDDKKRREKLK